MLSWLKERVVGLVLTFTLIIFAGSVGLIVRVHQSIKVQEAAQAREVALARERVGHNFRLKVGLTYKGQPIDINIVVSCSVHDVWSVFNGGSTRETMGMDAMVFAVRLPEGHAVAIRTIPFNDTEPCRGSTTDSGDIPEHWLPLITWYERDDEFAHGIAYATQDAYENPNARFGFRGARIEHAVQADYEEFRAHGIKNLLPAYLADWITHTERPRITDPGVRLEELAKNPSAAWRYAGWPGCRGVRRVRLTESQRAQVRSAWPTDHPRFWSYRTHQEQLNANEKLILDDQKRQVIPEFVKSSSQSVGRLDNLEIYPTLIDNSLAEINPQTPADDRYVQHTEISPSTLGFKFCDANAPPELITTINHQKASWNRENVRCEVNAYTVPVEHGCDQGTTWVAFEKDEYAILPEELISN